MRQLIVNADDFGLTAGINRAIVELHEEQVVASTSLMARAAATGEAIELACSMPPISPHVRLPNQQWSRPFTI